MAPALGWALTQSAPAALNTYNGTVTARLGVTSGQVWQALGNTPGTYDPLIDTALAGVLDEFTGPDALMRQLRPLLSRGDAVLQVNGQTLAPVLPGTSRSMATITAGELAGLSRSTALEFSFLLSIPTMRLKTYGATQVRSWFEPFETSVRAQVEFLRRTLAG